MIADIELRQTLHGFNGHVVRIYRGRYAGPRMPKGRRRANWNRYKVTIDSENPNDERFAWQDGVCRSAGEALLEVAGYDWSEELK